MTRRWSQRWGSEQGQISLLVLGMTVIALTLIIGATAVTSVQISRMRLLDVADTAALDAVDDDEAGAYEGGVAGRSLPVTDAIVHQAAAEAMANRDMPPGLLSWGTAGGTGADDDGTAVVRLSGEADLPLVGGLLRGLGGSVTVTVESRARADIDPAGQAP